MRKLITILALAALCPFSGRAQTAAHRIGQVIVKGNGIAANVAPNASIRVCVVGTQCSTIIPVFPTSSLSGALPQPLTADSSGNYNYWTGAGCVDEQISSPGQGSLFLNSVCPSTGTVGVGSVTTVSVTTDNGFQGTVTNPTTTPAIDIDVDGTHYLPTTTDESNWNGKQAALGFTPENVANKDAASGYAGLTAGTLLKTAEMPAFTGDATSSSGATALTLATVNSGPGSCGDATHVCAITTNGKGLVTAQTATLLTSVSSVSSGNFTPLFNVSVATATTTPAFTFTAQAAPINSVFAGAPSGSAVAPTFQTSPTFSAVNLTNFPTFNQSTTGSAATLSGTATATFALGATGQVGAGATTVCTTGHTCDETSGEVLLTTGTGSLTAGLILTTTLGTTRAKSPNCLVELTGSATYLGATKAETVTTYAVTVGSGLTASTPYTVTYVCGGK
jgi:hypothetical protein